MKSKISHFQRLASKVILGNNVINGEQVFYLSIFKDVQTVCSRFVYFGPLDVGVIMRMIIMIINIVIIYGTVIPIRSFQS